MDVYPSILSAGAAFSVDGKRVPLLSVLGERFALDVLDSIVLRNEAPHRILYRVDGEKLFQLAGVAYTGPDVDALKTPALHASNAAVQLLLAWMEDREARTAQQLVMRQLHYLVCERSYSGSRANIALPTQLASIYNTIRSDPIAVQSYWAFARKPAAQVRDECKLLVFAICWRGLYATEGQAMEGSDDFVPFAKHKRLTPGKWKHKEMCFAVFDAMAAYVQKKRIEFNILYHWEKVPRSKKRWLSCNKLLRDMAQTHELEMPPQRAHGALYRFLGRLLAMQLTLENTPPKYVEFAQKE